MSYNNSDNGKRTQNIDCYISTFLFYSDEGEFPLKACIVINLFSLGEL